MMDSKVKPNAVHCFWVLKSLLNGEFPAMNAFFEKMTSELNVNKNTFLCL
jgi:hypothetical protein